MKGLVDCIYLRLVFLATPSLVARCLSSSSAQTYQRRRVYKGKKTTNYNTRWPYENTRVNSLFARLFFFSVSFFFLLSLCLLSLWRAYIYSTRDTTHIREKKGEAKPKGSTSVSTWFSSLFLSLSSNLPFNRVHGTYILPALNPKVSCSPSLTRWLCVDITKQVAPR